MHALSLPKEHKVVNLTATFEARAQERGDYMELSSREFTHNLLKSVRNRDRLVQMD